MVLRKYQPEVIGVTGSAGKTSSREAIYTVLSSKFQVRQNIKNYNNEIGLPLTIIGIESPGHSLIGWAMVFLKALGLLIKKDKTYPDILVLEMGIDHPGDMAYLTEFVKPKIGVVTLIGPMHLEHFGTIEKIEKEKGGLVTALPNDGWAIVNYDDERCRAIGKASKAKTLTYGFDQKASVRAVEIFFSFEHQSGQDGLAGISFKLSYEGSIVPVLLPKVLGYGAIYAALAGAAVGVAYGMNLVDIAQALRNLRSPNGRMNIIPGIKKTLIIDDTYNGSPQPTIAALQVVGKIPLQQGARRIAVLGDMMELGHFTQEGHRTVGRAAAENKIDILIAVGERSKETAKAAEQAGVAKENVFKFNSADESKRFLQDLLVPGDLVLVKGSQSMRMEKAVKEVMADPLRAKELLVRQDWADA
jgi:UDP-N-acetylmuramoyl-tripeptide--D-alanyl-D-alanine ligase